MPVQNLTQAQYTNWAGISLLQIEQHIRIGSAHKLLRDKSHPGVIKLVPKHPSPAEHALLKQVGNIVIP